MELKDMFGSISIITDTNMKKKAYNNEIKRDAVSLGAIFP
jgi:hypothetical protein